MTWFKNFAIVLVGFLALATATPKTFAIEFSNFGGCVATNGGNLNTPFQNMKYNINNENAGRGAFSTATNTSLSYIKTTYLNTNSTFRCSYGSNWSKVFNYVDCRIDSSVNILCKLYDYTSVFNVLSFPVSGYSYTLKNGQTVVFDNIWLLDGSVVLYTDDLKHTVQYFPDYYLEDYVIFTDPLTASESATNFDNFFLISFPKKKARSMKLASQHISPIFKGQLDNYKISEFPFTNSYTLAETTNTTAFPKYSVFMNTNNAKYFKNDLGFNYVKDTDFIAPDFSEPTVSEDSPTYNTELINYYNSCVNKGENLRKALQLSAMCKLQGYDSWENIIINTDKNYTGDLSYCLQLDNFIVNAYNTYSGNWSNGLVNTDVNLLDNSAPFNDLIYSRYYNSVFVDSNNNISGLPNGNSWCSAYTVSNFYNSEKSTIEKISDSLSDFFGSGVAGIYNETVGTHSTFSGLISSISEGTSGFFGSYLFTPYIDQFNSGKTDFGNLVNVPECSVIRSAGYKEYQRGSIVLYGFTAILFLILLTLF